MTLQSFEEPMTAETFAAWSDTLEGDARHEFLDGRVHAMASERVAHARGKNAVLRQLERAIETNGLPCEAFPVGMAVRVDDTNVFEPDVTVRCGTPLTDDAVLICDPIIVVEVVSPSTQRADVLVKLARSFRNANILHYLIVRPRGASSSTIVLWANESKRRATMAVSSSSIRRASKSRSHGFFRGRVRPDRPKPEP